MGLCNCLKWRQTDGNELDRYSLVSVTDHFSVLPTEILELIFTYIRPKHLIANVAPVCRRFHEVLKDDKWWNSLIVKHPLHMRLCDAETNSQGFSAFRTYDAILSSETLRKNWESQKKYITAAGDEPVDHVRLFRKGRDYFCLAASGVQTIYSDEPNSGIDLWSLDTLTKDHRKAKKARPIGGTGMTHSLPINGIEIYGDSDQFLSCSDDHSVKLWDMGNGAITNVGVQYFMDAALSMSVQDRTVACTTGPFTYVHGRADVYLLDAGNGFQEVAHAQFPALTLAGNLIHSAVLKGNFLYILFSHAVLTVDIRDMYTPLYMQKAKESEFCNMSYGDGHLYCIDSNNQVNVLDTPDLSPCYSFSVVDRSTTRYLPRGVTKTRGSILVREPEIIKAFSLGPRPVQLGSIETRPLLTLDALDRYIVAGESNGALVSWIDD